MIGFVVPIKPKKVSRDWHFENLLLERTVKSICAQTDQNFKLIIVFNDKPEIQFNHPNIIFVHYAYPMALADDIEDLDYVLKYYSKEYSVKMLDKGKKIHFGCKKGIEVGCEYLMGVDSDDLISNKIAAFVNNHSALQGAGWRIKKGYIFQEDSRMLIKKLDIQNINGSTHIVRKDLITIPDFSTNIFWNYNLFEAHGYTYDRIKDFHKEVLGDCPFFGVIYVVHKNNYSNILELLKRVTIKGTIKNIVRGKLLSHSIRKEFGLYNLPQPI